MTSKMPKMPAPAIPKGYPRMMESAPYNFYAEADVIADRLACYLAGLEAARSAVPDNMNPERGLWEEAHNHAFGAVRNALAQLTKDASHDAS